MPAKQLKCTLAIVLAAVLSAALLPGTAIAQDTGSEGSADAEKQARLEKYAFDLDSYDGKGGISFEDLANTGEPFVLFWWLTDCPLCRLKLPYVQHLQTVSDEKGYGVQVITISVDFRASDIEDFVANSPLKLPILHDARARRTDSGFNVREKGTPLAYVFNGNAEVVDTIEGFNAGFVDDVLESLGLLEPEGLRE